MAVELSSQFGAPYFPKGGQGKLFHDPKPVDEHRYQRGYTPERMREVRNARIEVHPGESYDRAVGASANSGMSGPPPFTGHGAQRRIHEVIARSTTPASDFETTPHGHTPDDYYPLKIRTGSADRSGAAGWYHPGGVYDRGTIHLSSMADLGNKGEEVPGQTLLHELGHYHSAKVAQNPFASYDTPVRRGNEEAHADDNMVGRWRPDPRDVRRGQSAPKNPSYEYDGSFKGIGGNAAHRAYTKARQTLKPEEKADILKYGFNPHGKIIGSYGHKPAPAPVHQGTLSPYLAAYMRTGKMP